MNKCLWFLFGAVVGASVTYLYLNKKNKKDNVEVGSTDPFEDTESFDEVTDFSEEPHGDENSFNEVTEDYSEEKTSGFDRAVKRIINQEPDPEERKKVSEYIERVKKYNKDAAKEFSARTGGMPYVIDPGEYGDFEDYTAISLTHFADGVLVDDAGDILTKEEIDESVGPDYADYFGVYDDDLVVIRNDARCADYHIERDLRNSSEADEVNNNPPIIDWGEDD